MAATDRTPTQRFFDESTEQSMVKAAIVSKYFWVWARVILPTAKRRPGRIAYIDLFAGPGRYKDGAKSTPIRILEQALQDEDMREMLVTIFNDRNADHSKSLETAISSIPGIETLTHKPQLWNEEVGDQMVKIFEKTRLVPTLFFVDPWGYKGLSLRLINSVLKNWGCDCIFFFNYTRINMGLGNALVKEHMDALFGDDRATELGARLDNLDPQQRELAIVEEIAEALKEMGGNYILPFCFRNDQGTRTSHYLIFVSKHFKGYEIMREIMAKESSSSEQGVASFQYCPADARQPILFELSRPLDELGEMLLSKFAGQQLTMEEIYHKHSIGKPFISKNYKDVLRQLESEGKIKVNPSADKRPKRSGEVTFGDKVEVTFPARRG